MNGGEKRRETEAVVDSLKTHEGMILGFGIFDFGFLDGFEFGTMLLYGTWGLISELWHVYHGPGSGVWTDFTHYDGLAIEFDRLLCIRIIVNDYYTLSQASSRACNLSHDALHGRLHRGACSAPPRHTPDNR